MFPLPAMQLQQKCITRQFVCNTQSLYNVMYLQTALKIASIFPGYF